MSAPEIAILVSTFQRPRHLRRVLASIAAQQGVDGAFEVVVTDDGSRDETPDLVRQFAAAVPFSVRFTTHAHGGFHIARCRNEGVRAAMAPYLLFLDGDCIIPPDHVRQHLEHRRAGHAIAGYPIYLDQPLSEQLTIEQIQSGSYLQHVTTAQHLGMRWRHLRGRFAQLTGDPLRPKLLGGNLGIARADYERVNGYDENFRGWGCEDDDLRMRLRPAGVRVNSIAWWTHTFHLWHPKTPSAPATWREGANVEYFKRPLRLTRCLAGMRPRRLQDLQISIVGPRPAEDRLALLPAWCRIAASTRRGPTKAHHDLEIAFAGTSDRFTPAADGHLLVIPPGAEAAPRLLAKADLVFAASPLAHFAAQKQRPLSELSSALAWQLGDIAAVAARLRQAA